MCSSDRPVGVRMEPTCSRTPISEISALPPKRNGRNMCANTNFETGERRFDSAHSNTSISGPLKKFRKISVGPTVHRPDRPKYLVSCRHRTKKQMKFSPNFGFQGFDRREILACCPLQLSAIAPLVYKYVHSLYSHFYVCIINPSHPSNRPSHLKFRRFRVELGLMYLV